MSGQRKVLTAATLTLVFGLAACGKAGDTIPPPGTTFPRSFPAPRYVLPETADAEAGVKPEPPVAPQQRRPNNLQLLPGDDNRTTTRTIGPAPRPEPAPSATPETPESPETVE